VHRADDLEPQPLPLAALIIATLALGLWVMLVRSALWIAS